MDWKDARLMDSLAYDLVLGDWPRALNRTRIQELCNGYPPYSDQEVEENHIAVNINDLTHTRLVHDARTQFANGFLKTGNYFTGRIDSGAPHNRPRWGTIVTKEANRPLRRSIQYFERQRAKFGLLTLHGISPGTWETQDKVVAKPLMVGDVLIPSGTLLGFDNLPFYMLRRSFTGVELQHLTCPEKRDPGWNMGMVERVLKWVDEQTTQLRSQNWVELWAPEKVSERIKEDGGYFWGDQVPTVDTFDIYAYDDSGKEAGWIRRIILDSWGEPRETGLGANGQKTYTADRRSDQRGLNANPKGDFLYTSGKKKVAGSWQNLMAFQFADLSAVFPARYHSVRSLGWLIYGACHMGNRLRCKFYESVFEALMQMFKVKNSEDAQRALKLDLVNRGFIDETLMPVPANERWQVNADLVELGLRDNQQVTTENSASWVQNQNYSRDRTEKTRFQVAAELNATTSLVSAAFNQAYQYEVFEDREMFRRLCKKNSTDPMSRIFRENCLKQGVPEKLLNNPEAWDIEHERVMGAGNKTQELQIAQWLMEHREKFDPEPQRQILHDSVLVVTDDPGRADAYVPQQAVISDSVHDTELAFGSLLAGAQVSLKAGLNAIEVCGRMLQLMEGKTQEILQTGGVGTPQDLAGLQRCAQYVTAYMELLAENPEERQRVKQFGDVLGKVMNQVKAFAQRQQQAAQAAQQGGNGGMDAKERAKVQGMVAEKQAKIQMAQQSHQQRTQQRQAQFQQEMQQDALRQQADIAKTDLEAAANIHRNRLLEQ